MDMYGGSGLVCIKAELCPDAPIFGVRTTPWDEEEAG